MMAPVGFGMRLRRLSTFRASSKGHALLTWAWARSSELISIFGVRAFLRVARAASGMLASACGSDVRGLGFRILAPCVLTRDVFGREGLTGTDIAVRLELMTKYSP